VARAIWSGSLSFGLVNVPVAIYSATQDHEVRFHQFQRGTSSRIKNKRVNEKTGKEVDYEDIVKGAEVGDGEYVMLTPEELESVEPGRSRTIDITDFVDAAEIDPVYFQKSYYLAPKDETADKAYSLLARALEKAERIGIATFVMRNKQYLAAVRPHDGMLLLETMFFADEVRDPGKEVDRLPADARVQSKDVTMAVKLIESMTSKWDPKNYEDTYTDRVEQLIEAKRKNEEVVTEEEQASAGKVLDLMEALRASLDEAKGHKAGNRKQEKLKTRKPGDKSPDEDDGRARAGDEVSAELSKQELYDAAQELGIPGRSKMSRKQLAAAVAEAQPKKNKKRKKAAS
jgi:DNA end-binding protein Ku